MGTSTGPPRPGLARNPWTREQESRKCRRCGAGAGRQCVTASGTRAPRPHAERWNDAMDARGEPFSPLQDGADTSGRRPRSPAGYRPHGVQVRMGDEEMARLRTAAQRSGLSLAAELRRPFADAAEGEQDA